MKQYLSSTYFFDFENQVIQDLVSELKAEKISKKEKAISIYNKVRDHWKYNPYKISFDKKKYVSSILAQREEGNCVEKSIILISCLRAMEIPARLHLGKVKNHIAVERLTEKFGTNELTPHGMVNVYLDDRWLKMSPTFNKTLCEKFKVEPLDFDGERDSFLQAYNTEGTKFMEYTDDYGFFDDVPVAFMINNAKEHYPHIFNKGTNVLDFEL